MELKVRNYRINTISRLVLNDKKVRSEQLPESCGLALERRDDDGNYTVVAFIKPSDCDARIDPIGTRLLEIEPDEWEYVRELLSVAVQAVTCMSSWGEDND